MPSTYVIRDLNGEETIEIFTKKSYKKNQKEFRKEKVMKGKGNKLYVKWKGYDNSFNNWIDKKRYCYIKMSYFPEQYAHKHKIEVELDLSNYDILIN